MSRNNYRRSGFECKILLIVNCEFLYKTQSKETWEKEYAMNIILDHTPFSSAYAGSWSQTFTPSRSHACSIATFICMYTYSYRLNLLRFFKPTVNLPSATVAWSIVCGILLTAHPTCSLTSHTYMANIEDVAFSFGNSQSLESQSGL